jgi:CRISPR-associated protein Csc2
MSILSQNPYCDYLLSEYSNLPTSKFAHLVVIRKTQSETIFRTEGSGEPLIREYVDISGEPAFHIVMSKRKQTAVERRTGRELLRSYGLLKDSEGNEDILNDSNNTFEESVDAWVYGYAVGSGGAQKSRVITEDAFSLLPAHLITDTRTFNAIFDNGTMRHPTNNSPSTSLGSSEYVKPEVHFLDIETLKDVTADELIYVIGNVLRSKRYGAISSRIGRMDNTIAAVIFADTEIFSTLELAKSVYKQLGGSKVDHPVSDEAVLKAVQQVIPELQKRVIGSVTAMNAEDLGTLHEEIAVIYRDSENFMRRLAASYPNGK